MMSTYHNLYIFSRTIIAIEKSSHPAFNSLKLITHVSCAALTRFCKIIRKTMYIYKSEAHKKAENSIQLSLSKINFIQDSQQLEIMHPQMIKFTLRFDEPNIQELKKILLQIQKLITINYVGSNNCRRSMKEQFTSSSERLAHQWTPARRRGHLRPCAWQGDCISICLYGPEPEMIAGERRAPERSKSG